MTLVRSPEFSPPPNTRKRITSFSATDELQSSLVSCDAQRKRQERATESEQQRKERLLADRLRKRTSREYETEDQNEARLVNDQLSKRISRENETQDQRQIRLIDQQQRSIRNRVSRSEQRSGRLISRQQCSKATRSTDKQQSLLSQYVWPSTIPTQLKENCLQDFCNHMSMPVLRQSICCICNIRAYANTMKVCALEDIPNSDKLSCDRELLNTISEAEQNAQGEYLCIEYLSCYILVCFSR